jgi:hypothetical protein
MEIPLNNFVEYKKSTKNNTVNLLFDVKKKLPTPFEWTCAIEDFKVNMATMIHEDLQFAYILDVRVMGFLSISQIKEFSKLLESYQEFLEKRLICSAVVAEGTLIKNIFDIVKMFYKTVKPLKIVNNMDDAQVYIGECKLKFK